MAEFPSYEVLAQGFEAAGYKLLEKELEEVRAGEQGRVLRAARVSIAKDFAVKVVIPKDETFSDEECENFSREVACAAAINSPNYVVSVFDRFLIGDNVLCYVMEFVNASNLKKWVSEKTADKSERALDNLIDILWQVSRGLCTIHQANVLHRDLKESNIMVREEQAGGYQALITDFGFGYSYSENAPYPACVATKDSSYAAEGAREGVKNAGLDYYCFGRMIESILSNFDKTKHSKFYKPLVKISEELKECARQIREPNKDEWLKRDVEFAEELAELRNHAITYRVDPEYAQLLAVPELTEIGDGDVIRLAGQVTVPLTRRVLRIIDTLEFQKLRNVDQLSNVSLVYPSAKHTRFEHSIGAFNIARLVLRQLLYAGAFLSSIGRKDVEKFLLAALLHDIGHVPQSHTLEEMGLYDHEDAAKTRILKGDIAELIKEDWKIEPQLVIELITEDVHEKVTDQALRSILSAALDIDTMDYLVRDSIHLGVPYGSSFDRERLIFSFILDEERDCLAITHKGIVPAETFLIARYAMFSQVYLHHTVRSATAMVQRAVWECLKAKPECEKPLYLETLKNWSSGDIAFLSFVANGCDVAGDIIGKLSKGTRTLYKRFLDIPVDFFDNIAQLDYGKRVMVAEKLCRSINEGARRKLLHPFQILLDVPAEKYQKVELKVYNEKTTTFDPLADVSPLVRSLGEEFERSVRKATLLVASKEIGAEIEKVANQEKLATYMRKAIREVKHEK